MAILVVMGVAGSGKTTIAERLARELGWRMLEGDAFHPAANVAKMAAGTPLTDADRWPWLRAIAAEIDTIRMAGGSAVVACSALKRAYRAILIGDRRDCRLVYLRGNPTLIAERLRGRRGHFMPPALLESQFATLEPPGADENPIDTPVGGEPAAIIAALLVRLREEGISGARP
jgi:gluconokinase